MPGGRHGPDARVHAALPRLTLILLLATVAFGCGNGEAPIDLKAIRFSGKIVPKREITSYGEILPCAITITNDGPVPVFIDRVEALSGHRRTLVELTTWYLDEKLAVGPAGDLVPSEKPARLLHRQGLVFPGQSFEFLARYRVLDPRERLLLTIETATDRQLEESLWIDRRPADATRLDAYRRASGARPLLLTSPDRDPSRIHEGGALADVACPPHPFDPRLASRNLEGWTYSTTLGGYVLRNSGMDYRLLTATGSSALPPLPFEFLDDVDYIGILPGRDPTTILTRAGKVVPVPADEIATFLGRVAVDGNRIRKAHGGEAEYEVIE